MNIFELNPELQAKTQEVIQYMKDKTLDVETLSVGRISVVIVKDGTQEAEDRKSMIAVVLGTIESDGQQYLIAAK